MNLIKLFGYSLIILAISLSNVSLAAKVCAGKKNDFPGKNCTCEGATEGLEICDQAALPVCDKFNKANDIDINCKSSVVDSKYTSFADVSPVDQ